MAKYLIKASYNAEGFNSLVKHGAASRVTAFGQLMTALGGSVEAEYFAFGNSDVYVIADLPDNVSAAALATAVSSSGQFSAYETVVLVTVEEMDAALAKAVAYRPPSS